MKSQRDLKSIEKSLKEGLEKEVQVLETINKTTKHTFYKTKSLYSPFDFTTQDEKYNIELKSRNNTYDKYPTTIINIEKIRHIKATKLQHPKKRFYFLFNFTNGLYYIKYKSKLFDTFKKRFIQRFDRDINKLHLEIPITELKPIEKIKI